MYYKPETGQIFNTHSEIRSASINVLYPEVIDDDMLAYNGIFPLAYAVPAVGPMQIATALQPELVDDVWTQMWSVRDATPEEIAEIEAGNAEAAKPKVTDYVAAVQGMLDEKAQERRYDSILSACTYATSTQPKFQAEGQACVAWRDSVWAKCYELMDLVDAGTLAQPTVDELLAMLPVMEWPV